MKKLTKKEIDKLKPYWKAVKKIEDRYWLEVYRLEDSMKQKLGKEYEFFHCDGELAGIGDVGRTIKLIHPEELE